MKVISKPFLKPLLLVLVVVFAVGCKSLMATFDQAAYSQVTSLNVDAMALMDKSTEDYSQHTADVAALRLELDKAIEYDKHRPNDQVTNAMWNLMSDTTGHLLGGFLVKWKKDGKESHAFVTNIKVVVDSAFSQIAELEIKKIKSSN
jgi:hypothetical protein